MGTGDIEGKLKVQNAYNLGKSIGNLKMKLAKHGKSFIQNSRGVGYKFVPPDCAKKD